jgi:hypothetical protein
VSPPKISLDGRIAAPSAAPKGWYRFVAAAQEYFPPERLQKDRRYEQ